MKTRICAIAILIALSQSAVRAKTFLERKADCINRHLSWSLDVCDLVAKGQTSPEMTQFQREEAEQVAAELRSQPKKAAIVPAAKKTEERAEIPTTALTQQAAGGLAVSVILLVLAAMAYFLPGFAAQSRHHHQRTAIWVLNFFLGWTVLGWIAALVWASTATRALTPQQN